MQGYLHWPIAGPLIGLFVPLLYVVGAKAFGISSSFDHLCTIITPAKKKILINFDMQKNGWKLFFVFGVAIGAVLMQFILSPTPKQFLPDFYYGVKGYIILFAGGLLIGFGTRYANGCTSGHAITGLSLLNPASLVATLSFFISGMLFTWMAHFIF